MSLAILQEPNMHIAKSPMSLRKQSKMEKKRMRNALIFVQFDILEIQKHSHSV